MKKLTVFLTLILAALVFFLSPVGSQYVTKIYHDTNGDRMVVDDGGVINILAGGALQYAGIDILNTITPGMSAGSGVVVLSSTKSIDSVTIANRLEVPSTSTFYLDDTSVTASGAELNILDGVFSGLPGTATAKLVFVSGTFSSTTANIIPFQMASVDADDMIFVQVFPSSSTTCVQSASPVAGAIRINMTSAPAEATTFSINILALED